MAENISNPSNQEEHLLWEKIRPVAIEGELKQSYIDYAMTVIVSRALPDTRDWLKPVIRRILYAMHEMKLFHNTKHKKSARIVWDTMWKYHPHWDSSIYEAMVRLAQPWSLRYPLVDWQWNFWSIDWDSAAAMRYTEARMTKIAEEMLKDIDKDTIDWRDNFDWSLKEPVVLSTRFPNHLCNWTMWIAVWMATNMPPHNLTEVIDACLLLIEKEWKPIPEWQEVYNEPALLIDAIWVLFNQNEDWDLILNKELADYLLNLPWKKIVVTNANKDKLTKLLEGYDFDIYSLSSKPDKTNSKYFEKLIDDYKLQAKDIYYFDHLQDNLNAAKKVGIVNTRLYENNSQIFNYLDSIKDKLQKKKLEKYNVSIEEIMQIIKWPDFPTGWYIFDSNNILQVYKKWKWAIVMRWKTHIEEDKKGQKIIVIDEIPYQVNKSNLVKKIWELVVDKKLEWVEDVRDESAKNKIRIAIYLKKWVNPDKILVLLYKMTELQSNFNVNNVSLVDNWIQPRLLNIKDMLMEFINFRRQVVYRRSVYLLQKAEDRLHILQWLKKAIDIIDDVIATIRSSESKAEAKQKLIAEYEFTEIQAEYILLMRLQSLVWLEMQRIVDEIEEKKQEIEYLKWIINDADKLDSVVIDELQYIKDTYWDERKTQLVEDTSVYKLWNSLKDLLKQADMIKEDCIFWIGNDYSVRMLYQSRVLSIPENTIDLIYTHNQDKLIVITDLWELVVHRLKDFGSMKMSDKPIDLKSYFKLKWNVIFAKTLHFEYDYLFLYTSENNLKKIDKNLVLSFKKFPTKIMKLPIKWEKIISVLPVKQRDKIWIVSQQWYWLLFNQDDLRPMWKTAWWVKWIDLQQWDKAWYMFLYQWEPFIFISTKNSWKMLSIEDLRIRKRAKKWDIWATWLWKEIITWALSIDEWWVTFKFEDWTQQTIHSDDLYLWIPESWVQKITSKNIKRLFRPWEEKEENLKYKEEKKKQKKWNNDSSSKEDSSWWLFE